MDHWGRNENEENPCNEANDCDCFVTDPLDEVMCPSPAPIPHSDFERIEGWLTSNGALHGTVLEYSCQVGYRDARTPCLPTRRTCHAGKWVGNMPTCGEF